MARRLVHVKLVWPLVALSLSVFGVPPCAVMDMDRAEIAGMPAHQCCEGDMCPTALGAATRAPMSADCCAFGTPVDRLIRARSTAASDRAPVPPPNWSPQIGRQVVSFGIVAIAESPPARPTVPLHLLLSVLLI